jgi:predicted nucleic acid-binding Zn ribbon protein
MFKKKQRQPEIGEHKFCPACGTKLQLQDTFCLRCGYSFAIRAEKNKIKGINKRNLIIILIILLIMFFGLRYSAGQTLWPRSIVDALNTFWPK